MSDARAALAGLSDADKRRMLAAALQARASQAAGPQPLSDAQLGLWFQQQREPDSAAYNMPLAFGLHGRMRSAARPLVQAALNDVIARHGSLRTVFVIEGDEPRQRVLDTVPLDLSERDFPHELAGDWRAAVPALTRAQAHRAFDLASGPLFRFELLHVDDELHVLLATFHHIVMDGWSIGVFLKDFAQAFIAHARQQPLRFEPLDASYAELVARAQAPAQRTCVERDLDYWQARLAAAPRETRLPTDYRRETQVGFAGATHAFDIDADTSARLTALAQAQGATAFMTMLASFQVLLARLCGQDDLVLGVSVSNRDERASRGLVGLFSDVLPMRGRVPAGASFARVLDAVRGHCLADLEHGKASFTRIIERCRPARDTDRGLLFQVGFDFQNTPWPAVLGDHVSLLNGDSGATKLDLNLNLSRVQGALSGVFEYDTQLFRPATIARFAECYRTLLRRLVEAPHAPLDTLVIDEEAARRPLSWPPPPAPSLLDCVRAHASSTPDAPALEDGDESVSYAALLARAGGIATALEAADVRPGDRVGLVFARSAAYVQALLGTWLAGAAYVPLDPELPAPRRDHILTDAGVRVVLSTRALAASWGGDEAIVRVIVDDISDAPAPAVGFDADATAYVIYTSGTTGQPKGVMVGHAALAQFARLAGDAFALAPGERALQFASISFDTSAEEIFPALVRGATVVFPGDSAAGSVQAFLAGCATTRIGVLNLPTAYWHEVVDALTHGAVLPDGVRLLIIGGEAAAPAALVRWQAAVGTRVRLLNTYGPTETTVSVTCADLTALAEPERLPALPIGTPYPGVQVHVVDRHGRPVPTGVVGELWIGGPTLAQGYLGAPELTAAKFTADPFATKPGARVYRTGDHGRRLADGSLEFVGRRDDQVKLLGFRVELGDIEATLQRCRGVARAAVVLADGEGPARLAAFIVVADPELSVAAVREWAQAQLPAHMLPARIALVDALPTTVSGKIDRAALAVRASQADAAPAGEGPRDADEATLAAIWAETLGLAIADIHANFFDLGGHSLLMIRLLSRVRRAFGVDVPLARAFAAPTIASLAREISTLRADGVVAEDPLPAPAPRPRDGTPAVFRQSFPQQSLWFLERLVPGGSAYHNPSALQVDGPLDLDALGAALAALVARHEILRTVFAEHDGVPVQVVLPTLAVPLQRVDLRDIDAGGRDAALQALVDADARAPFDLVHGPLLRLTAVRVDDEAHVLLFNWHHIVTDAWTLALFLAELGSAYRACLAGDAPSWAAPASQYAEFAEWQWRQADTPALATQIEYWRETLADAPTALALPTDGAVADAPCRRLHQRIERDTAQALAALARKHDATLFMVGLAAFKLLLARVTGQADLVVGTPISGRVRAEFEQTLGYFINTLALRTRLDGAASFTEVLTRVRAVALAGFSHQQVPLERVVRELARALDGVVAPPFEASFVFETRRAGAEVFPGARIAPRARGLHDAKFPLTLAMREVGDGIECEWEVAPDRVAPATLAALAAQFAALLAAIAAGPAAPLAHLSMLASGHRALLQGWSAGKAVAVEPICLHEAFARQVQATPDVDALVCGDARLSYVELDRRANRLAHLLRTRGVGPDARVGVCLQRSPALAVALLAVWKAGGAYVPLDPEQPAARLNPMLVDSGARWVLTETACLDRCAGEVDTLVLDGAQLDLLVAAQPDSAPVDTGVTPDHLAYVIFTSGSTGRPKGVMVEHRSVANLGAGLRATLAQIDVRGPVRWAWNASVGFDASVQALLQWAAGSTLHLLPAELRRDPAALARHLRDARIDVLDATPLLVEALLDAAPEDLPLPSLVIGGEAIAPALWQRLVARYVTQAGGALNVYGPTEATVDATAAVIAGDTPHLGRPLANVHCHVLDLHGQAQPPGVAGELFLGGPGLARGYVAQPELTAERFVMRRVDGVMQRLYATGDRVRWRADGTLDYLGRLDDQLKLRGHRIEPGEVEHALRALPGVAQAVVLVHGIGATRSLAAWLVPAAGIDTDDAWLAACEQHARAALPGAMVPAWWTALPALPRTGSGKLDRAALPPPRRDGGAARLPLAGATEMQLAQVWAALFEIEADTLGAGASFFRLGGHSLLLMRLASAVRARFGVEPPLKALFEAATLRAMAALIDAHAAQSAPLEETEW